MSLVEVTLALGIAGFCLIACLGVLPVGLNVSRNARHEQAVINASTTILSDIRSTSENTNESPLLQIGLPSAGIPRKETILYIGDRDLDDGRGTFSAKPQDAVKSRYRVRAIVETPSSPLDAEKNLNQIHLLFTWPPEAEPAHASGSMEMISTIRRR